MAIPLRRPGHEIALSRCRYWRRRRWGLGSLPSDEIRLERRGAGGALGPDRGLVLARRRRLPRAQRQPQHGDPAGLHDRPLEGSRSRIGPVDRHAHDRRHSCRFGARTLGVASVVLSPVPGDRHRGCPPGDAGGDQGPLPDHQRRRRARGHVGRPRGLCRHHRDGLGLCRRGQEARRDGDRAQSGAGAEAAPGLRPGTSSPKRGPSTPSMSSTPAACGRSRSGGWSGSTSPCRRSSITTF